MKKIPKELKKVIEEGKIKGEITQDDLMAVLPKPEEDIELLDAIYSTLVQSEIELIENQYSSTWDLLEAYDRGVVKIKGTESYENINIIDFVNRLEDAIHKFINSRFKKGEKSELFGQEKSPGSLSGIIKCIFQTWDQVELYKTVEEKAANLLYFIIKDHPFNDGNKRCGTFAFICFLQHTKMFDLNKISSEILTLMALLVAESDPKNKETIIAIIINTFIGSLIFK